MKSETNKFEPYQIIIIKGKKIDIRAILFVEFAEINRDVKKVHFADSSVTSSVIECVIEWRTRLSAKRIIDMLGSEFFIQIHRRYIINKYYICARKSDWKDIQLSLFLGYAKKDFLTNIINIGMSFLPEIRKFTQDRYIEMKDEIGDVFFINPFDIVYIEISKETKTVYFDHIYPDIGNRLEWVTRLSATDIINRIRIDGFYKIHRRYIINCNFPFKPDSTTRFVTLNAKRTKTHLDVKPIRIGSNYKSIVGKIIS